MADLPLPDMMLMCMVVLLQNFVRFLEWRCPSWIVILVDLVLLGRQKATNLIIACWRAPLLTKTYKGQTIFRDSSPIVRQEFPTNGVAGASID